MDRAAVKKQIRDQAEVLKECEEALGQPRCDPPRRPAPAPVQRAFDIGHADIWNAAEAPQLFWQPLLSWIVEHRED